jgi:hypothetical protein
METSENFTIEREKYVRPLVHALRQKGLLVNEDAILEIMKRQCYTTAAMFSWSKGAMAVAELVELDDDIFKD